MLPWVLLSQVEPMEQVLLGGFEQEQLKVQVR
jgi:hypothetical protein